jgi:hypothetical protein
MVYLWLYAALYKLSTSLIGLRALAMLHIHTHTTTGLDINQNEPRARTKTKSLVQHM